MISGQAEVTHGYEQLATVVLDPGEEVSFGSNEWHATSNASPEEALVAHLVQTPGHQWAQFMREGAALQQGGATPHRLCQPVVRHPSGGFSLASSGITPAGGEARASEHASERRASLMGD